MADAGRGQRFKLLLQRDLSEEEFEVVVGAFLRFVESFHRNELDPESKERLATARFIGGTILIIFNQATGTIEPIDPTESGPRTRGLTTRSTGPAGTGLLSRVRRWRRAG